MRTILLIGLAMLTAAASQADTKAAATAAIETPAPAKPATETATSESARPFRSPPGWKVRRVKGEVVYCRNQTAIGSRMSKDVCMTQEALKKYLADNEEVTRRLEHSLTVCGSTAGCASN